MLSRAGQLTLSRWLKAKLTKWFRAKLSTRDQLISISVLVSISVFVALSTVLHSINSPDNSPSSHSVRWSYLCRFGPFNYMSRYESTLQPLYNPKWLTGLKTPIN